MKISNQQYAQTLFELVKNESPENAKKIIADFARLLVARHDAYRLDKVLSEFNNFWNKEFRVIEAVISSFSSLNKNTEALLRDYIQKVSGAQEIETTFTIDKSILGGVVIKYGDRIFDAGLKSRLEKLKEKIIS